MKSLRQPEAVQYQRHDALKDKQAQRSQNGFQKWCEMIDDRNRLSSFHTRQEQTLRLIWKASVSVRCQW